jgi:penicillin-binding protein 1A
MPKIRLLFKFLIISSFLGLFAVLITSASIFFYLKPELPSMDALKDVRFQIPLRVYTHDEKLIAEFGEKRRTPIKYKDVPDAFIKAVLAAEDQNFFNHSGIDIKGLSRAVKLMIQNRGSIRGGGGSTITMQLTRALFLNNDRKFKRKFKEIILSIQLEGTLSKEEILELYFNEIYLGKRAYGIQAAANVYYDKNIEELSIAQLAMIAGLPKAPSSYNPINNPERALVRRDWILGRMLELNFISEQQYNESINEQVTAKDHGQSTEIYAPYVAEMIRNDLYNQFGEEIYTEGYKAYATILSDYQRYANEAVYFGIHQYNERHGYKGPIKSFEIEELKGLKTTFFKKNLQQKEQNALKLQNLLKEKSEQTFIDNRYNLALLSILINEMNFDSRVIFESASSSMNLELAITLLVDDESNTSILMLEDESLVILETENILWAAPFIDRNTVGKIPEMVSEVLKPGDLVYLRKTLQGSWRLAQLPEAQSAFTAIDPNDGAILALVGGYDYNLSKYNRVIQSKRQAGSSFKPFIYTKALELGYTAATIINDAPVVFNDAALEETWRPENSGGRFYGPTRFRQALYRSRNLVSIRILRKIGITPTIKSMQRFGFEKEQLPANLSLSLGSASLTPLQVVSGFTVFANGGHRVFPYYLKQLKNSEGEVIFRANPAQVCIDCDTENEINTATTNVTTVATDNSEEINLEVESSESIENISDDVPAPIYAESILEPRVNYIMDSILTDVIKRGTGRRALALGRTDIRGKTGTTNDQVDAWFTGYNNNIVASVWFGFDAPQSLGRGEYGAVAALPVWLAFMEKAMAGKEEKFLPRPDKLVTVKINSKTGEAAKPGEDDAIFEIFREEFAPQLSTSQKNTTLQEESENIELDQLF